LFAIVSPLDRFVLKYTSFFIGCGAIAMFFFVK
jgi:hypothetical protein